MVVTDSPASASSAGAFSSSDFDLPVPAAPDDVSEAAVALEGGLRQSRPLAIGALLAAVAVLRIGAAGTGQVIGLDLTELGLHHPNGAVVGAVGAAQAISEMVAAPVLARYADRFGRTRFLILGPLLGAVGVALLTLAVHPFQLALFRLIEGVAAAAFVPTALGTVAAATTRSTTARAQASGAFEAATMIGYAGGFALGPLTYYYFHRVAFVILAGLYVIAGAVCFRFVPRVPPLPVSPLSVVIRAVLGRGPIRAFLPGWMAVFALIGAFAANLSSLLSRSAVSGQSLVGGFDDRVISLLLVSWVALILAGIAMWTPFLPRLGASGTMRRALPGGFLVCLALGLINHLSIHAAEMVIPFLMIGILILAGFGPAAVAYLAECSETFAADRSALMAFYTVTLAGGGALGAVVGGLFVRWLYMDGLVIFSGILVALASLSLTRIVRYDALLSAATARDDESDPFS